MAQGAARPRLLQLLRWLLPFACLYISFGMTLGFLVGGAPLILRVRGVELAQVGLIQAMNLPLGLTFLWAGFIDRIRLPHVSHRVGWIGLMQGLSVALLVIVAAGETFPLAILFGLGVATCFCVATMDIALEALVVETVSQTDRVAVSSAKFCGASIGGMLGNGVVIGSFDQLGWAGAVAVVAVIAALSVLPIIAYPERSLRRSDVLVERPGGKLGRLRALASRVAVLGFYFAALNAISGVNGLALIDLGWSLATVGMVSGGLSPFLNLVMALLTGLLLRRFGTVPLITGFAAGLIVASGVMLIAMFLGEAALGLGATILTYLCSSALGVPVFNMLYRWSEGPRAATDYSILFGAAFFASMPLRIAAPSIASVLGWPGYFAVALALYGLAVAYLLAAIRRDSAAI